MIKVKDFDFRALFILAAWSAAVCLLSLNLNHANDFAKQWKAARCVLDGQNPYALTLSVLNAAVGPEAARKANIFEISQYAVPGPSSGRQCEVTDTTYPPSALGVSVLCAAFGGDDVRVAVFIWFVLNVAFLGFSVWALGRLGEEMGLVRGRAWIRLVLVLLFFPVVLTCQIGQFSLAVLAGLLGAMLYGRNALLCGFFLFLVLFKPTLAVPLLVFLAGKDTLPGLAVAVLLALASAAIVAALTSTHLGDLYAQWLEVGRYYAWNKHWTTKGTMPFSVRYAALAAGVFLCFLSRVCFGRAGLVVGVLVALSWTYSSCYDAVLCLPLMLTSVHGRGAFSGVALPWRRAFLAAIRLCCAGVSLVGLGYILTIAGFLQLWGVLRTANNILMFLMLLVGLAVIFSGVRGKFSRMQALAAEGAGR